MTEQEVSQFLDGLRQPSPKYQAEPKPHPAYSYGCPACGKIGVQRDRGNRAKRTCLTCRHTWETES